MLAKLEEFKHLNGFYRRPGAREVVFRMYSSICQVCGSPIQSLSDMWVGHRTPRSHWEYFEVFVEGQIDIDNLLNLQPEHIRCNMSKSNSSTHTPTLFQSALDQASREVRSVLFEKSSHEPLGLEIRFDLSSAVRDGPSPDWLWLSLNATDNIVQEAFKVATVGLPEAYLPEYKIASIVIGAPSTEAAKIEFDGSCQWVGGKDSALCRYASALWEREKSAWWSSGNPVSPPSQRLGWYVFPHGTDLNDLRFRVYSPDHQAAMNLQRFSNWIESGQSSKSGSWVCKGDYVTAWSSLHNQFHDLVSSHAPLASFEVAKGRAQLHAHTITTDDHEAVRGAFKRLFIDDENFRKGRLDDDFYAIFNRATVRSFLRKKELRIKKLANSPTCQKGAFGTAGFIPL